MEAACERLGLRRALTAGQCYLMASMAPEIRPEVARLVEGLVDGHPAFMAALSPVRVVPVPKPCPAGVCVKGGTSRGKGSGSRLRLWVCRCEKPVRVRVASDNFRAHCDVCGQAFQQPDAFKRGKLRLVGMPPRRASLAVASHTRRVQ